MKIIFMILALAGQLKQLSHEPEKCDSMGFEPIKSPEFFRFMRQLLKLSSKCEDHIFISSTFDFWLEFCEKKCGLYTDVYGICIEFVSSLYPFA